MASTLIDAEELFGGRLFSSKQGLSKDIPVVLVGLRNDIMPKRLLTNWRKRTKSRVCRRETGEDLWPSG